MERLARFMAILGGLVLTILIVLVCVSVFGRTMNGILHGTGMALAPGLSAWLLGMGVGPINGDFELVEAGIAFSIFAFLPLCHLSGGHATVDIFTSKLPDSVNRFLRMVIEVVFAVVMVVIALRLYEGMVSKHSYGETTFLLQFPVWWAYVASLFGAVVAAIISVYIALMRVLEFFTGRTILTSPEEPTH